MAEKGVSLDPFQRIVEVGWGIAWEIGFTFQRGPLGAGWPDTDIVISCNGREVKRYERAGMGMFMTVHPSDVAGILLPQQDVVTLLINYSQHATGTPGIYGLLGWGSSKSIFNTAETNVGGFTGTVGLSARIRPSDSPAFMVPVWG